MCRSPLLIALLFCFTDSSAQAQQLLRWKFTPEETWYVAIEQRTTWHTTIGGKTSVAKLTSQIDLSWKINESRTDGVGVITQTIDRLRMLRESAKLDSLSYDSAAEQKPTGDAKIFAEALQPLVGSTAKVVISARGEVLEFSPDEKTLAMLAKSPNLIPWKSEQDFQDVFRNSLLPLPEQELKTGDTWQSKLESNTALGKVKSDTTFTLASLEPCKINSTSQMDLQLSPETKERQFSLKSHQQNGEFFFDVAKGRLTKQLSKQELVTSSQRKENVIEVRLENEQQLSISK